MTTLSPDRVVIISDFSKIQGGASKLAVLHAGLLKARNIPVTFICGDDGAALPAGIQKVALNGQRLLESSKLSAAVGGLWNSSVHSAVKQWISDHDTGGTIYHVHGYHQTLSPSVLAPLACVRHRVALHAHDYFLACPNGAFFDYQSANSCTRRPMSVSCMSRNCDKRSYAQKLWRLSRQALQNKARAALCPEATTILIHAQMEMLLFPDGPDARIAVVPNPAEPLLQAPVHAEQNQDIVYVGDIHHYKGVDLLARAGKEAGVQIRFVGAGQDLQALKQAYPEHKFDGWQDSAGLKNILTGTRLLVSPTLGPEPFGLAPAEALLSGIPVVLSDSMLLAPQIVAANIGRDFPAGNCTGLATLLKRLKANDPEIAKMSLNARSSTNCISLGLEEWADALSAVYTDMLAQKRAVQ